MLRFGRTTVLRVGQSSLRSQFLRRAGGGHSAPAGSAKKASIGEALANAEWFTIFIAGGAVGLSLASLKQSKPKHYVEIREEIKRVLEGADSDGDGLGPSFVRLAWHASGTYDAATNTGGSHGSTMRFPLEKGDPANAGLDVARDALEQVKIKYPYVPYAELWTLAAVVAIEHMGGPRIGWRSGRFDLYDEKTYVPPNGRLPDAAQGAAHIRATFYRMGFNDQEIVALLGAHCLGRGHTKNSGYDGPWTYSPTVFSNDFYKELLNNKWVVRKWDGPKQFTNEGKNDLMMLPGDMALIEDAAFRGYVQAYAKDQALFFKDFAKAFQKLEELGVPYEPVATLKQYMTVGALCTTATMVCILSHALVWVE